MSEQHTSGPWSYVRNPENTRWIIDSQPHHAIACTAGYEPDSEANARLIAAAPDLLAAHLAWEAAEDARNDCNDYEDGCDNEGPWESCPLCSVRFGDAIDLRHAAIAKATARQHDH